MRILVIGGTGVLGSTIINYFKSKKIDYYFTSRQKMPKSVTSTKSASPCRLLLCPAKPTEWSAQYVFPGNSPSRAAKTWRSPLLSLENFEGIRLNNPISLYGLGLPEFVNVNFHWLPDKAYFHNLEQKLTLTKTDLQFAFSTKLRILRINNAEKSLSRITPC